MLRFPGLLLCVLLLFLPLLGFAAEQEVMPLGTVDFSSTASYLDVSHSTPEHTSISLHSPTVVMEERVLGVQRYKVFGIEGEPFTTDEGYPMVPHVSRLYRIPELGGVDLVIRDAQFDLIENVDVMPEIWEENPELADFSNLPVPPDDWFPKIVAEKSDPMIMRDFRVVSVTLYPVQVNPHTRQARVYRNIDVDLVSNNNPAPNEITQPCAPSGAYAALYRSQIANLDESALTNATRTPGSYLIITKSDANQLAFADSLFVWKTRMGFHVVILSQPTWTTQNMVTQIHSNYNSLRNTSSPLEYVCLMGDPQSYGVPTGGSSDFDHVYALGDADDMEDIAVGRLSGGSSGELATINAKNMGYERNPVMTDTMWYHRAYLSGDIQPPSGSPATSNYRSMQWAAHQFGNFTCINNCRVVATSGHANESEIISQYELGICFHVWRGSWLSQMSTTVAGQTNPAGRYPIMVGITCGANEFSSGLGIDESYLVAGVAGQPRGAVCSMGTSTSGTHNPPNICMSGGFIYNACNLGVEHVGTALVGAKYWLWKTFTTQSGQSSFPGIFSRYCNLMGEPSLSMWTCVPVVMNVTHPTVLNVGAREIVVQVHRNDNGSPIADAMVTAWKRGTDSTYARGLTDAEGNVTLPLNVNTTGDLFLTVTKHNHKPYLYTINCVSADNMVMFTSYTLDDDNSGGSHGNGDGVLNPGETIDIPITLKNFGNTASVTNVHATLSSTSNRVTIVNGTVTYPDLVSGQQAPGNSAFRVFVAPEMQQGETAQLLLTVTTSAGENIGSFVLTCVASQATYQRQAISGFAPGATSNLSVTVKNTGNVAMTATTGHLISLSPFVQVDSPNATFGDIAVGALDSNLASPFTISSNSLTFRGHQAPMLLLLTSQGGHVDTAQFIVTVGTATTADPTGPDGYGYFAYDNTDTSYEVHPHFSYVDISQTANRLALNDVGEQPTITPTYSIAVRLPFTFKFYGRHYDTLTICSNGWVAFGDQSYNDLFRNYPMPAMQAPDAMIAPYWDDLKTSGTNQGVYLLNDDANHRVIIQWKASGGYTNFTTPLDFEVILMDTAFYPTTDGNGQVLVQYQTVSLNLTGDTNDANGSTTGIQDATCTTGLNYVYSTSYATGAAPLISGRAILFTTMARQLFGVVKGVITDAGTSQPLPNANVELVGYNYHAVTNALGQFRLNNVLIGSYSVRASMHHYNDATATGLIVLLDDSVTQNLSLTHPEMTLSADSIQVTSPDGHQVSQTSFDIHNGGNGPLDYSIRVYYAGDINPDPWDSVGAIPVSQLTGNPLVQGCEMVGNEWWLTASGAGQGPNVIYRYNRAGNVLLGTINQPSTTNVGWFDMAYDGQYVYGSDSHDIIGIDASGVVHATIPSPMNPTRALAYDPASHHFFVTDYTQDIYEIDRLGNIINRIPNSGANQLAITGLAWNPTDANGMKLYIFSQNGTSSLTRVTRLSPTSLTRETVIDLPGAAGDRAAGCTITPGFNSALLVFAGVVRNNNGARMNIYEMSFNTTWISVIPSANPGVPGGNTEQITLSLNPAQLLPDIYRVDLRIASTVLDTTRTVHVKFIVPDAVPEVTTHATPQAYALHQNYPNPFNPTTMIRYDVKEAGLTTLTVFDLMGRKVADLVNTVQAPGSYTLSFDATNLPSGMYFYRLESGKFVSTQKMVLMK